MPEQIHDPTSREVHDRLAGIIEAVTSPRHYIGPAGSIIQFNQFAAAAARCGVTVAGKRCLDFGCGPVRPLGVATLLYLAGAKRVVGVDLARSGDPGAVATTTLSALLVAVLSPGSIDFPLLAATRAEVLARIAAFDPAALLEPRLEGGVPDALVVRHCRYDQLPAAEQKFDVAVSNSVFEHVADISGVLTQLRRGIADDGALYAAIDYKDHRIYSGKPGMSAWQYMIDGLDEPPGDINRLRHSEMMSVIRDCGFAVADLTKEPGTPSDGERARFLPAYRDLSEDDVGTLGARVLLRPA